MRTQENHLKAHPFFKLGKEPAKRDIRNIKFAAVLKALPTVPTKWDFDIDLAKNPIPTPVFRQRLAWRLCDSRNDPAFRIFRTRWCNSSYYRYKNVINEYKREGGSMVPGQEGLNILDSLNSWRKKGWKITGHKYSIYAFTELDHNNIDKIKVFIRYLNGAYIGLALPNSWREQIDRGQPWDIVHDPNGKPNPRNGHCVYLCGYTPSGPVCVTWGRKQAMT